MTANFTKYLKKGKTFSALPVVSEINRQLGDGYRPRGGPLRAGISSELPPEIRTVSLPGLKQTAPRSYTEESNRENRFASVGGNFFRKRGRPVSERPLTFTSLLSSKMAPRAFFLHARLRAFVPRLSSGNFASATFPQEGCGSIKTPLRHV